MQLSHLPGQGRAMEALAAVFCELGIPAWGVCAYEAALPTLPCRAAARLPEHPRSILMCLFPYYTGEYAPRNVARYAVSADYHRIAGGLLAQAALRLAPLFPGFSFVPFVDNGPIREVYAAYRAGLGVLGKNGQLITPEYGSYCFFGELVTDLPLAPSTPLPGTCRGCGACLAACPHGALGALHGADGAQEPQTALTPALCRSFITQKKGELTAWESESVRTGGLAWGCDLCTDCCPHNRLPKKTPIRAFYESPEPLLTPENCRMLCKTRAYGYRGAATLLRNLALTEPKRGT